MGMFKVMEGTGSCIIPIKVLTNIEVRDVYMCVCVSGCLLSWLHDDFKHSDVCIFGGRGGQPCQRQGRVYTG